MKHEIIVLERIDKSGLDNISKFADLKFLLGIKRDQFIIKSKTKVDKEFLDTAKNLKVI